MPVRRRGAWGPSAGEADATDGGEGGLDDEGDEEESGRDEQLSMFVRVAAFFERFLLAPRASLLLPADAANTSPASLFLISTDHQRAAPLEGPWARPKFA